MSQADVAAIASALSAEPVTYIPLTLDILQGNLVSARLPQPVAEFLVSFDLAAAQSKLSPVSSSIQDLTRRKPRSVADFLAEKAQAII